MDLFSTTQSIQDPYYTEIFDETQSMQPEYPVEIDLAGLDYPGSDYQEHDFDIEQFSEPSFSYFERSFMHDFEPVSVSVSVEPLSMDDFDPMVFGYSMPLYFDETPASTTIIQNLPTPISTEEGDDNNNDATYFCSVCLDGIKVVEEAKQLPCSHWYHAQCIMQWLEIKNSCPLCRFQLPNSN